MTRPDISPPSDPGPPSPNPAPTPSDQSSAKPASPRLTSIDAYRGMVMLLMLTELVHLYDLADHFPDWVVLKWLAFHTTHVAWEGCSLHDLIQPSFTFLVGVAMPFSIASRLKRGHSQARLLIHAAWRSGLLIGLGIALRSIGRSQIYFTFEDTLTQIGLGYFLVVGIALMTRRATGLALAIVLVGFWGLYAIDSPPPADFDYASVGVPDDWPHHHEGFASRWNKNSNLSWRLDTWWLNLFPRESTFTHNSGGYATLSFVPTIATMLLGLIAGRWLRDPLTNRQRLTRFAVAALLGITLGAALAASDLCPNVKRIWTPSFALFSGGWLMAWMGALHWITDIAGWRRWSWPLIVIGANSILTYVMAETVGYRSADFWVRCFGHRPFQLFGAFLEPQWLGVTTIAVFFAILVVLYRRRIFIRI